MIKKPMKEENVRAIIKTGALVRAVVRTNDTGNGYNLFLFNKKKDEDVIILECKQGGIQVFETIDSAVSTAKKLGFYKIIVVL
ncbi:hypothetical protein [Aeromonas veronii]|uniref:Plasmid replication protein RepB n=1 Tax=Aeromonas veronii TaxID=654 RepID=A0A2T4MWZ5_AERVE|nr:hypothetical protein [Aeromonas veronii]PTH79085.1 hypothetical protein DAA48_21850 [Aeromonas veronii]